MAGALLLALAAVLGLAACAEAPPCPYPAGSGGYGHSNADCVTRDGAGRFLVVRHRFTGLLGLPGGGAEPGESARCTAFRETWEETGVTVAVGEPVELQPDGYRVFRCALTGPLPGRLPAPPGAWLEVARVELLAPAELGARADWRLPSELQVVQQELQGAAGVPLW